MLPAEWQNGRKIEPFNDHVPCPSIYDFPPLQEAVKNAKQINAGANQFSQYSDKFLFPLSVRGQKVKCNSPDVFE